MVTINLTNRWLYTFALIIGIFALAAGVYAVAPNPGHTASEVDFSGTIATLNADQVCLSGDCQTSWPSGGGGLWSDGVVTGDIHYSTGDVGVGTSDPEDFPSVGLIITKGLPLLAVSGSSPSLLLDDSDFTNGGYQLTATAGNFYLEKEGISSTHSPIMIDPAGDVTIGTNLNIEGKISSLSISGLYLTTYQHDPSSVDMGVHDLCFLARCKGHKFDDDGFECFVVESSGSWSVWSYATNDNDAKAQAGAYCVDF